MAVYNQADIQVETGDFDSYPPEKTVYNDVAREGLFVGPLVDNRERSELARGLKQRHVQMIAIAGAIVSDITFY